MTVLDLLKIEDYCAGLCRMILSSEYSFVFIRLVQTVDDDSLLKRLAADDPDLPKASNLELE